MTHRTNGAIEEGEGTGLHQAIATSAPYFSESMRVLMKKENLDLRLTPCQSEAEVIRGASEAEAIITTNAPFPRRVMENLQRCRFIIRCGVGLDNFDINAATEKGVLIAYLPDWYHEDLTNHVVAFILNSTRKIHIIDRLIRTRNYSLDQLLEKIKPVRQLKHQVLGLIGFGKIAGFLLPKLLPFKFRILVYDPHVSTLPEGLEKADLPSLLGQADIISIHCPLNEQTRGLIGEQEFNMMRPGVYIINTARGAIINEEAFTRALRRGKVAGAALDVVSREPVTSDHPLLQFENVIVTPHISWYSEESLEEVRLRAAEEVIGFFKGRLPSYPVNPEVWASLHQSP